MSELLKFFIELIVTFIVIFIIYYFVMVRQYKKIDEKKVPTEVNIILKYHKIDLKKINYKLFLIILSLITSFIISLVLTVTYRFIDNNILVTVVSIIVSIPIALAFYDIVGRYFEKKSNEVTKENKKEKKKESK